MNLTSLLILVVILGLVLWLFNSQIPVPAWVKTCVNVVAVLIVMIYLLQLAGFSGPTLRLR